MIWARGPQHVYRRGGVRWLLLFTMWWLVALSTIGAANAGIPAVLVGLMVVAEAAILTVGILEYRSAVIVGPGGLTVRGPFRTQRFDWNEVIAVDTGSQGLVAGPSASIRLQDGRSIATPLWSGGLGVGNRSTQRSIQALRNDVEAHRRGAHATSG